MTVETFLHEYWEKQPLVLHRDDPGFYSNILTLADIDHILTNSSLNDADLRLVAEGQETSVGELLPDTTEAKVNGLEMLFARYRAGATVNVMFLHERWPPLTELCQTLSEHLSAGVHANVYLTPPGSRGLTPHHDTHDVLVMQLYGTKNWTLHPTQTALAMQGMSYSMPPEGAGDPIQDFVMRPGDVAYLPRGTVHAAKANDAASLHLTIGINPMTWATVMRTSLEQALVKNVKFREALPVGFASDDELADAAALWLDELLSSLADEVRVRDVITEAASRMLQRRHPSLAGHLLDLEALPSVDLQTTLRRRPALRWKLRRDDEQVHLEFHGKVVDLPEFVEEELSFIIKADEFTGADIPGSLDDAGRLVLIQQLLREGFLTTA
jgi:ribosomal protein L16 Arg81 hydroxylase